MPKLSPEIRNTLIEEYKPDISFVERVTGRTLPHWRK
jgi:hypothetical protein